MNIGHDARSSDNGVVKKLIEFDVVLDGEEEVSRRDTLVLVVLGTLAGELEHLGAQVLDDAGHHDRGALLHHSARVEPLHLLEHLMHGQYETRLLRLGSW